MYQEGRVFVVNDCAKCGAWIPFELQPPPAKSGPQKSPG